MNKASKQYIIGIEGGGTKTISALAGLEGKILKIVKTGASSPRNLELKIAIRNIAEGIQKLLKPDFKILSTFLALPAVEEEFSKEEVKKELLKIKKISSIFRGKFKIGSDQLSAFKAGTTESDGVVLISGTGSVAHGWRGNREKKVSGWGYLADEGSAFFIGQEALRSIFKETDGRGKKTLIKEISFSSLRIKNIKHLMKVVYSNPTEMVPCFSFFCSLAEERGDEIAKNIMLRASEELILTTKTVIKNLNFQKEKFPLVLVGGVFKSQLVLAKVKKEIKKFAPQARFIVVKDTVKGAVRLAQEQLIYSHKHPLDKNL